MTRECEKPESDLIPNFLGRPLRKIRREIGHDYRPLPSSLLIDPKAYDRLSLRMIMLVLALLQRVLILGFSIIVCAMILLGIAVFLSGVGEAVTWILSFA